MRTLLLVHRKMISPRVPKAIFEAGSVSVWNGNGYTPIDSKKYGSLAKDYFGSAVSAGDINGDGKDDLILSPFL